MEILDSAVLKDGVNIQLENWSGKLTIGAYPIAKNTSKYRWVEAGRRFRLDISENEYKNYSNEDLKLDYEGLKLGNKTLIDLSSYFRNGNKDRWYMGMDVENLGY